MEITWNDVKKGNPTKNGYYLTTVFDNTFIHYWNNDRGQKKWYSLNKSEDGEAIVCENVLAWATLPKPYKA